MFHLGRLVGVIAALLLSIGTVQGTSIFPPNRAFSFAVTHPERQDLIRTLTAIFRDNQLYPDLCMAGTIHTIRCSFASAQYHALIERDVDADVTYVELEGNPECLSIRIYENGVADNAAAQLEGQFISALSAHYLDRIAFFRASDTFDDECHLAL